MNKKFVFVAILVFVLIGSIGIIMARENENIKMKVEKAVVDEISEKGKARVIVVMKDYVKINKKNKETRERAINEIGNEKIKHKFDSLNAFSAFLNEEDIEKFANNENVEKIYFDRPVKVFLQDSVPLINASLAWRLREKGLNLTGKEQTVCIIDTGVNYSHINLGRCFGNTCKIINGYDFVNNDNDPKDDHGHGTHVTGIVAANGSLNGVAPEAKIVAIKALDSSGNGYISDVIKGIEWCTNNASLFNISVISMSLGVDCDSYPEYCHSTYCDSEDVSTTNAINAAIAKNISVVIATGNDGKTNVISEPACIKNATRVGSTTKSDEISGFSNRWALEMLFAPGSSITSTCIGGGLCSMSGTSMATPHVAGAIAIINQYLKSNEKSKTPQEIETALNITGKIVYDSNSGRNYSRINVYNAIISFDSDKPVVNLINPINNYFDTKSEINLTFRCNASDLALKNLTFYLWNSSTIYNQTFREINGSYNLFEINITNISEGEYLWNCEYYDLNGNGAFALSNYSFEIKTFKLNVSLPKNNSWYNGLKLNVSLNMDGFCWFSLDNGVSNNSMENYSLKDYYYINLTINESLTNKDYNAIIYCNNSYGDLKISENIFFGIDKTAPKIVLISPDDGYSNIGEKTINFEYNVSDNLEITSCCLVLNNVLSDCNSSYINKTATNIISKTLGKGSYSWGINCTDETENVGNSSYRTLTINEEEKGNGGGGGGGGKDEIKTMIYVVSDEQIKNGYTKLLRKGDKIKFDNHSLTIDYIGSNFANITIMSEPTKVKLVIGEERKFNLLEDNYFDLYVRLNGIVNNSANITIKKIYEKIIVEEKKIEKEIESSKKIYEIKEEKNNEKEMDIRKIMTKIIVLIAIILILSVAVIVYEIIRMGEIERKNN